MGEKICKDCQLTKPSYCFTILKRTSGEYLNSYCKECKSIRASVIVECDCGMKITKQHFARHLKRKIHVNKLNSK